MFKFRSSGLAGMGLPSLCVVVFFPNLILWCWRIPKKRNLPPLLSTFSGKQGILYLPCLCGSSVRGRGCVRDWGVYAAWKRRWGGSVGRTYDFRPVLMSGECQLPWSIGPGGLRSSREGRLSLSPHKYLAMCSLCSVCKPVSPTFACGPNRWLKSKCLARANWRFHVPFSIFQGERCSWPTTDFVSGVHALPNQLWPEERRWTDLDRFPLELGATGSRPHLASGP